MTEQRTQSKEQEKELIMIAARWCDILDGEAIKEVSDSVAPRTLKQTGMNTWKKLAGVCGAGKSIQERLEND